MQDKYPNRPKMHKLEKLALVAEAENIIGRNSGVINVYTFLHADLEGVDFYAARQYVHLQRR